MRYYEEKLTKNQGNNIVKHKESTKSAVNPVEPQDNLKVITSTQWRKIDIGDSNNLVNEGSSFEEEVDRIGRYLQRN